MVTEGVYAKVRHPIYAADIVLAWGVFLRFPSLRVLVSVVWLTGVLFFWMRLEEKALLQKFGKEYEGYQERVPMILPRFK